MNLVILFDVRCTIVCDCCICNFKSMWNVICDNERRCQYYTLYIYYNMFKSEKDVCVCLVASTSKEYVIGR